MQTSTFQLSILAGLFTALTPMMAIASELSSERLWRSPNGKELRGTWVRTIHDTKQVEILTSPGKLVVIAISNLSEPDRALVAAGPTSKKASSTANNEGGDLTSFKEIPALDRDKIPMISQSEFGNKQSDCVPSSFCNFLLWWDQAGVLEIPKRGDFDAKAEWVHSRVARYCVTRNNSGTGVGDAVEGSKDYFEKDIADLATLKIRSDFDLSPANLARYTVGENATMLGMTVRRAPRHDSGHWVALISASDDGSIVFNTWGTRFEGKMEALEKHSETLTLHDQDLGYHKVPATSYEIKIRNTQELPEWFRDGETKLILDPANWDGIFVLKPFVYREKGKLAKAPADPLLDHPAAR